MALLLDSGARSLFEFLEAEELSARRPDPAATTLDDLLSGAWEGLAAAASTACPVCDGALTPRWSAGAGVVGGRCGDCGSELS
jgi:hypothetical protein